MSKYVRKTVDPVISQGLVSWVRKPLDLQLRPGATISLASPSTNLSVLNGTINAEHPVLTRGKTTFSNCFVDAQLHGDGAIVARNSVFTGMIDGIGLDLMNCQLGSARRPDGGYRPALHDGLRVYRVAGSTAPTLPSSIDHCDIINLDGRKNDETQHGLVMRADGHLKVMATKIFGWPRSAVTLRTDNGPIDNVTFFACAFAGAEVNQLVIADGGFGHGRPTNVSIVDCVIQRGSKGNASGLNTGDGRASADSQTKFVRTEAERLDPTWIVFDKVVTPDRVEISPPGGWYSPSS